MDSVCVHCENVNTVNSTNNRLVTESCGHVKCMNCLLSEKTGCLACSSADNTDIGKQNYENNIGTDCDRTNDCALELISNNEEKRQSADLKTKRKSNGSKSIKCPVDGCGKLFTSQSHYKYHMLVHRNDKCYVCDICKKGFYARHNLNRHIILLHTKEKNHVCPICKKAFYSSFILKEHSHIHTGAKPYQCQTCDRGFRDRSNYYRHVSKAHKPNNNPNPNKLYKCPQCDDMFQFARDVRRHSSVHRDLRPFRCKICPEKKFKRKDNLERHIRNYHPDYASMGPTTVEPAQSIEEKTYKDDTVEENLLLKTLNPLPPLSKEIIEQHLGSKEHDKSYILQANNARESVIVQKNQIEKQKDTSDSHIGYVHKIRRAHAMVNQKDVSLPPINETKMRELAVKKNFGPGSPPTNTDLYKRILL